MNKRQIAILFGGYSGERVISERSAQLVMDSLNPDKYSCYLVDIAKGHWRCLIGDQWIEINKDDFSVSHQDEVIRFDGAFCAIHGTPGEDGKLQGYFDMLDIPYNNCGVLASSLTFDKASCNRFLKGLGVQVAKSVVVKLGKDPDVASIVDSVGIPCFVKPNDGGSSIGISKVKLASELPAAIERAQAEGVDALVEEFLDGYELSCGCFTENGRVRSTGVTEIIPENEFFDFESKYNSKKTQEITPARINEALYSSIQQLTEEIYGWLKCKGMIRVDYMVCDDQPYVIEVNTTPGISPESIIPKQVKHMGMTLEEFFSISVQEMFRQ